MAAADTSVSLDEDVTEEPIGHIRNGTTDTVADELEVPIEHFVSPERAQAEIALLRRMPLIAGHISEIPRGGDFVTRDILGASLLITRQDDGSVSVYRNMCKHRGGRVEQKESGHKRIFMCRYHGWSYNGSNGALRPLPYADSYGRIGEGVCVALDTVQAEVRHGLIFVDLSGNAERTIESYLGAEVEAQLAPWGLERATIFLDKSFNLAINWKLVMDGAIDSLHAQYLHPGPGNVGARTLTNVAVFRAYGRHGRLFQPRTRLKKLIDEGADLQASSKYVASLLMLYPNAMAIGAPDHVEFWTVWPSADPSRCTIRIRFLVRPEILTPEMEARINKSWEILSTAATNEDFPMETWIQENATAWPDGVFRYGRNEVSARHLHLQLARDMDALN